MTTYLSSRDSGAGGVAAPTASRTPSLDSEVSNNFTGPSGRSPFRRLSSPAPPLPFSTVRQSEISRSSPRSPLRRLRRSRSNRSIKYSLPGATQFKRIAHSVLVRGSAASDVAPSASRILSWSAAPPRLSC